MELQEAEKVLSNRRVLITGHTGFTGTWAQIWLEAIGAKCYGISFENRDKFSMRKLTNTRPELEFLGDITDANFVDKTFKQVQPEFVLHLAAQPIVSIAYKDPFRTISTNTQGTAVVLDACLRTPSVQSIVCVTTDKVYKNSENGRKFIESDELGGGDPYSASKSAAEHIIEAYRQIKEHENHKVSIQVARGGNIIGGGDYSQDRIIPDLVKAIIENKSILVRQPNSTRPWQHVLSLVHAYILLLAKDQGEHIGTFDTWNFGPVNESELKVSEIVRIFEKEWQLPGIRYETGEFKESHNLRIDSTKAINLLGWSPKWNTKQIFSETISWYMKVHEGKENALSLSKSQLSKYRKVHSS